MRAAGAADAWLLSDWLGFGSVRTARAYIKRDCLTPGKAPESGCFDMS
jgi:hypothetical protein